VGVFVVEVVFVFVLYVLEFVVLEELLYVLEDVAGEDLLDELLLDDGDVSSFSFFPPNPKKPPFLSFFLSSFGIFTKIKRKFQNRAF